MAYQKKSERPAREDRGEYTPRRRPAIPENDKIAHARYHLSSDDGLYRPFPFLFVSPRMRDDILDEREMLLSAQAASLHERQQKLFSSYDPGLSAEAFRPLLRLYGYPFNNRR